MGVNGHWYVEIRKQAYWRGNQHTWVNRYVMSGAQPTAADALTVINQIHDVETAIFPEVASGGGVGFVDGKAYPSGKGSFFAIVEWNEDLAPGTATGFTGTAYAGSGPPPANELEVCLLLETPVTGLSSTGKPVYLRKYYRGFGNTSDEVTVPGQIPSGILSAIELHTSVFQTGMGASNWVVIGNNGEQASGPPVAKPFLYNRQVPKGRKRATSSSGVLSLLESAVKARGIVAVAADAAELGL